MTGQLASLPPELLSHIVSHIDPIADKASLAHLALTNRQFRALVTPTLYHTVCLGDIAIRETDLASQEKDIVSRQKYYAIRQKHAVAGLLAFLRTVLASPDDLAPLVRSIQTKAGTWIDKESLLSLVLEYGPRNPLLQAWEAVAVRGADNDMDPDGYWGQHAHVLAALLLPRIHTLHCSGFSGIGSPEGLEVLKGVVEKMAPEPGSAPPFWKDLTDVEFNGVWDKYPPDLDGVAYFAARWPKLKRIYTAGYIDTDEPALEGFQSLQPAASSLESLVLGPWSQVCHENLNALLQAPRALKVFRYCVGHPWSWIPFQTDELQKSLEHQKDSLQELSVTHSYYNFDLSEEDDIDPMSFVKFMALRVLEISLAFVFGGDVVCYDEGTVHRLKDIDDPSEAQQRECAERLVEMLPESLETIRFAQCGDEWTTRLLDRALLRVLEVGAELLPRLRTIEVHVYQGMEEAIVQGGGPF
ncbi:uncharacterized protein PG998_006493 [Apiospora kogelbergensis]|uniref:uncharacterized protein n=1 Tax=Apiospora kogelbergensis TaxID=1337665 RepID=UPI00312D8865